MEEPVVCRVPHASEGQLFGVRPGGDCYGLCFPDGYGPAEVEIFDEYPSTSGNSTAGRKVIRLSRLPCKEPPGIYFETNLHYRYGWAKGRMPRGQVWQDLIFDNQTSSLSKGTFATRSSGIRFCNGDCGQICCEILKDRDFNKLYFVGDWTESEKAEITRFVIPGLWPDQFETLCQCIGLQHGARPEYISEVYPSEIVDLSQSNQRICDALIASMSKGVEVEGFSSYYERYPTLDWSDIRDGEPLRCIARQEYRRSIVSIAVDRVESIGGGWFRPPESRTVRYLVADLHEYLSVALLSSAVDIGSLTGHWVSVDGDSRFAPCKVWLKH